MYIENIVLKFFMGRIPTSGKWLPLEMKGEKKQQFKPLAISVILSFLKQK